MLKCLKNLVPRPKGYDSQKVSAILTVLISHREGVWLRALARLANMHPSTANRYLAWLAPLVEIENLGQKPLLRVVRLKPAVLQKLDEGYNLGQILRYYTLLEKVLK